MIKKGNFLGKLAGGRKNPKRNHSSFIRLHFTESFFVCSQRCLMNKIESAIRRGSTYLEFGVDEVPLASIKHSKALENPSVVYWFAHCEIFNISLVERELFLRIVEARGRTLNSSDLSNDAIG